MRSLRLEIELRRVADRMRLRREWRINCVRRSASRCRAGRAAGTLPRFEMKASRFVVEAERVMVESWSSPSRRSWSIGGGMGE